MRPAWCRNRFSHMFTTFFLTALALSLLVRAWLAGRQMRHVAANRASVPQRFVEVMPLAAHQKAADYTIARTRLGMLESIVEAALLVCLTLMGGIEAIDRLVQGALAGSAMPDLVREVVLVVAVLLVSALVDLPFSLYREFVLEARFGFSVMTWRLYLIDTLKVVALAIVLGLPLLLVVLWLMQASGRWWWLYAWTVWSGFSLVLLLIAPTIIAPLFNKFVPLEDEALRGRVESLLARCGFAAKGVFVMDGSTRSTHGNAYFTGFGAAKRIVFFDTLIERLNPEEIEAVLAHELGHFRHHHVIQRIVVSLLTSFAGLAVLGWLIGQPWFFEQLGVEPSLATRDAVALLLFFFVMPIMTFLLAPLFSQASRRHEYQADAFAAEQTGAGELSRALVKLYEDNAATLTPDPLHSAFYDSHPPAALRIARLDQRALVAR